MISAQEFATVEAWLQWFDTYHQGFYRTYLCTRYHLDPLDAEALMNAARIQVFLHWNTLKRLYRTSAYSTARTVRYVAELLEQVRSQQRQILEWYAKGYEDAQVAAWLGTSARRCDIVPTILYETRVIPAGRWSPHSRFPVGGMFGIRVNFPFVALIPRIMGT